MRPRWWVRQQPRSVPDLVSPTLRSDCKPDTTRGQPCALISNSRDWIIRIQRPKFNYPLISGPVHQDDRDILSQSFVNSLPPPSKERLRDRYVVRFASADERRRAEYMAADLGPVSLLRGDLTIGLTNETQRESIDEAGIPYEVISG